VQESEPELAANIHFDSGDMLAERGSFDYVVAMDSLIHYELPDMLEALEALVSRTGERVLFTFAPRTPALALMHRCGKLFPKKDRSPAIVPVAKKRLHHELSARMSPWQPGRDHLVDSGFYKSHVQELKRG
jgi:magnesium-protoporphyrin O-methyltransferase